MRSARVTVTGLLAAVVMLAAACPAAAKVTDEEISAAIDRGVNALLAAQNDKGWWTAKGVQHRWFTWQGGWEAYAMLALAYAGVPMSNPKMEKGFEALLKFKMGHTYNAAARIMVISKLLGKLDRETAERARKVMLADVKFLVDTQRTTGGWEYPHEDYFDPKPPERRVNPDYWDFSNTQMAVLGLSEAIRAGVEVPRETMLKVQTLYLEWQHTSEGGWGYGRPSKGSTAGKQKPYGSMSAAAVASLFITRDYLYPGVGCPCRGGRSHGKVPKIDQAINNGLGWLGKQFAPNTNPPAPKDSNQWVYYWLYSCERVGLASGVKYFGTHDWYAEGAAYILAKQHRKTQVWGHPYDTAYALCFLVKGRAPILFNKLQFDGEWNSHPRDVANLVKHISAAKEQPFQWQIINLQAPVAEWHDAPVLYITAESALELADADRAKLREFTDTGGTILFEASCGNPAAKRSWTLLCKQVWPEFELKALDREHPLWSADQPIKGRRPILFGMSDGLRTFMMVTWRDISCAWHTLAVTRQAVLFDLGSNLYVYATDRRPLRARLAAKRVVTRTDYTEATIKAGPRPALKAARVKHADDWYAGRNYRLLARLASAAAQRSGIKLTAGEPAAPSALKAADVQVAWLTGRQKVGLADEEAAALKAYLQQGGFLLAEAAMGDTRFDAAFRGLASQLGLTMRPVGTGAPLVTGKLGAASGFDVSKVKVTFALRGARIGRPNPDLFELRLDDKPVGVYSPADLSYCQTGMDAFGCRGYAAEDARAILTNILLLATTR